MANMKDVAERAGVSTATVSHVINETRFVAEETRNEVLKAMKELKYYPNSAARILRKKESKIIGLVVPDISNFFFTGLARKIETVIKKKGYNIILGNSDEKIENEVEQIKIMNSYLIDGLIMAPARGDQSYLDEDFLADNNFPIVFIDRMPKGYHGDCVLVDNEHASYKAVNYLIQQGHRRIGIITGLPELTTTEERLIGYKKAFRENGLEYDSVWIEAGDSRYKSGYNLCRKLLEENDLSALFVTNNLMSIGAMNYIREAGIKVPEDIALIGFDDYRWATITFPPLSVVKQPVSDIGKKAGKLILEKIANKEQGKNINGYQDYRFRASLKLRDSC